MESWDDVYLLSGPTASGKSAVALELAERLGAEIISLDSMAVYRGMDIGTAKPTLEERRRVPHHLVDVREPHEQCTVAWWCMAAQATAAEIRQRSRRVLIVGGTPLYLKALLRGLFAAPPADPKLRQELEKLTDEEARSRLQLADPTSAARLHSGDRRRVLRALEVWLQTGQTMSALQRQFDQPAQLPRPGFWLDLPRPALHQRIHDRIDRMLEAGWLEECRRLLELPNGLCREARQAAGYAELFAVFRGELPLAEAIPRIQTRTRQLAKRQVTWLRHLEELRPWPSSPDDSPEDLALRIARTWTET